MLGKALVGTGVAATSIGAGMALGAYAGQTNQDASKGMAIGAGLGLGAGIGAVAIGSNADKIASSVGKGILSTGQKIVDTAKNPAVHEAVKTGVAKAGQTAIQTGAVAGKVAGVAANVGAVTAIKAGAKYGNIAASMFKVNPNFKTPGSNGGLLKLTKGGVAMIGAGTAISAGVNAFKAFNDAKAGTSDGQVLTATPQAVRSSNMRNAGATGDLAFAMYAQRRG